MVLATTTLLGWMAFGSHLQIPNGYDLEYDRTPARFARPVSRSNLVSLTVNGGRYIGGPDVSLRFDEDNRTLGEGGDVISVRFKWKW